MAQLEQFRINISFDGLDADDHVIDMRLFGEALIGLERTLSTGLNAIANKGVIQPRSKLLLAIKITPPREGSVELDAVVETAKGLLPLLSPSMAIEGAKIARLLISAVLKRHAGQKKQSSKDVDQMLDLMKVEKIDRQAERHHIENVIALLRPAATQIMAPIGRSCEGLTIADNDHESSHFDVPMAQAIRSKSDLEVSDMKTMRVRIDGVVVHTKSLKIEDPDEPGHFINAEVRDPAFTDGPNIYTESVTKFLDVEAKATYRDGRLYKLHIMDAREAA